MACLRLLTFWPLRPLRRVPRLRLRIAPLTSLDVLLEYLRGMKHLIRAGSLRVRIPSINYSTPINQQWFHLLRRLDLADLSLLPDGHQVHCANSRSRASYIPPLQVWRRANKPRSQSIGLSDGSA